MRFTNRAIKFRCIFGVPRRGKLSVEKSIRLIRALTEHPFDFTRDVLHAPSFFSPRCAMHRHA